MKRSVLSLVIIIFFTVSLVAQNTVWKLAGDKITTKWAAEVNPVKPLPEYPRPQMVRDQWINLNGLWDYAITPVTEIVPGTYQGKILVPFPVESALSGVRKTVGPDNILWYRTKFLIPSAMKGKNILLHFGAIDWESSIYINGIRLGVHKGGYDPFSFDITQFVKKGGQHTA